MGLSQCKEEWARLIELEKVTEDQIRDFLCTCSAGAVGLIRETLRTGGRRERDCAFRTGEMLELERRQELLPDLVALACEPSYVPTIHRSRDLIMTFSSEWLSQHVESAAEPLLASQDEWIYRRLLELYAHIGRDLTLRLAKRAAGHPNSEIREAGDQFIANPGPR
jgi:hypothetical protein